jgi:hypothetical protein
MNPRHDFGSALIVTRFDSDGGHDCNGEDAESIRLDRPLVTPEDAVSILASPFLWWGGVLSLFAWAGAAAIVIFR